jgi:hypothetical protein
MKNKTIKKIVKNNPLIWIIIAVIILIFITLISYNSFLSLNFILSSPSNKIITTDGSKQTGPISQGHSTAWSNDDHGTQISQEWNDADHSYFISWYNGAGHLYTASHEWIAQDHSISTTYNFMENPWWDYGHESTYSFSKNHNLFVSKMWQDDDHLQTFSHKFVEFNHDYTISLEEFYQ